MSTKWLCVENPTGPRTAEQITALFASWDAPDPASDPSVTWTPWGSCPREA